MCVEAFVAERAITITFMHEQIWFDVGHQSLRVTEVIDWFIRNDGPLPVEVIRLQFPYYIDLEQIEILSGRGEEENEDFSWYGNFATNGYRTAVRLDLELNDARASGPHNGQILSASLKPPVTVFPAIGNNAQKYIDGMSALNRMVADLHLDRAIPSEGVGWLRIRVSPRRWPDDKCLVPLEPLPFLKAPSEFMARLKILSPEHLRVELEDCFRDPPYSTWAEGVIDLGWKNKETLTRIEDHRITLLFPEHVRTHVTTMPQHTLIPIVPYPVPPRRDQGGTATCALHFVTGSHVNERSDIVTMAGRICNYLKTVYPRASAEHLVNRFGGDEHEVVGTLIEEMIRARVIVEVERTEEGTALYKPNPDTLPDQLIALRKRYTHPDHRADRQARRYYDAIRDLHPFCISLTLGWRAPGDEDRRRLQALGRLIDRLEDRRRLPHGPRHAVLVGCSRYGDPEWKALPRVRPILDRLARILETEGGFDVTPLMDPGSGDEITEALQGALRAVQAAAEANGSGPGLVLFWFLGHGRQHPDLRDLQLLYGRERGVRGLPWASLVNEMKSHQGIHKVAVLDCCHSGWARHAVLPRNTFVWPTANENDAAPADDLMAEETGGKICNFTWAVADLLERGLEGGEEMLGFSEVFDHVFSNGFSPWDPAGGCAKSSGDERSLRLAFNRARPAREPHDLSGLLRSV